MSLKKVILLTLLTLGFVGCRHTVTTDKPVITVSIEPQRWLLEQIVGDRMEVQSLIGKGADPESYEPTFGNLALLERSRAYLTIGGLPFETSIVEKVQANCPELIVRNSSDSIDYILDTHGETHCGNCHSEDPHIWNSARNMRLIAAGMLKTLKEIDPDDSDYYEANFRRLTARIDSVDAACDSILSATPGASFMVWHPSLSYFARDYGLTQLALGLEGKEHTVGDARRLLEQMEQSGAQVFLIQKDIDPAKAQSLTDGVRTEVIDPMNYEWDREMVHTARSIAGK